MALTAPTNFYVSTGTDTQLADVIADIRVSDSITGIVRWEIQDTAGTVLHTHSSSAQSISLDEITLDSGHGPSEDLYILYVQVTSGTGSTVSSPRTGPFRYQLVDAGTPTASTVSVVKTSWPSPNVVRFELTGGGDPNGLLADGEGFPRYEAYEVSALAGESLENDDPFFVEVSVGHQQIRNITFKVVDEGGNRSPATSFTITARERPVGAPNNIGPLMRARMMRNARSRSRARKRRYGGVDD